MGRRRVRVAIVVAAALAATVLGSVPVAPATAQEAGIALEAIRHDSRDGFYRTPFGAVPAGTSVTLRLATAPDDVADVTLRLRDDVGNAARELDLERVLAAAPCPPAGETCDVWETTVQTAAPTTLRYRFTLRDGDAQATYADGPTLDGGLGRATAFPADFDFVITVFDPGFETPDWLKGAVVYQVFPDRFANGDPANDADETEPRYGYPPDPNAQVRRREWSERPEQPPRGRDFFGGDLAGLTDRLRELREIGVEVIYLNPIFAAGSNHLYDTRDYRRIDPRLGTDEDWDRLVAAAADNGIRLILDGVFNHVGSDSPYFDRYGRWDEVGACESVDSPYRSWFLFRDQADGPCAGPDGPNTMGYFSWANFDSLPVLAKTEPAVVELVYGGEDAVAREWLRRGAAGWRLDVMMDASFPDGFWAGFRAAVKETDPEAAVVGELWKRDEILPRVRGDTADTFMNYRFRNAVQGYLGRIDNKGFPDDGQGEQPPSVFADKVRSVIEDVPRPAWETALNLLGTHDTERILWSLAPGSTAEEKEAPDNVALATERLRLAALLQYTLPGAPTVYYGDEVGVTGGNDPDDRRTYPLDGGDRELRAWYVGLAEARAANPAVRTGELRWLALDDPTRALGYARAGDDGVAIVAVNPGDAPTELRLSTRAPLFGADPIRDGVTLVDALEAGVGPMTTEEGELVVPLGPRSSVLLVSGPGQDLAPPGVPDGLTASVAGDVAALAWGAVPEATTYAIERSLVAGGGFALVASTEQPSFRDEDEPPAGAVWVYRVRAVDQAGNVGAASAEVVAARAEASATPTSGPAASPGGGAPAAGGSQPPLLLGVGLLVALLAIGALVLRRGRTR